MKRIFERKTFYLLFKKDPHYANENTENQHAKNQTMTNPINSFNERKNKEKTKVIFSITQENDLSSQ
jgi:hypothetical protein